MSGLVQAAAVTANADYGPGKNEITFVSSAIRQIGDVNARQRQSISALHDSIRICALENLLVMGVYTQREEAQVLRYFGRDFSSYCVLKCRVLSAQEGGVYRYEGPRVRSGPASFDLAILFKLYDVVISGDGRAVDQIFGEILQAAAVRQLSQQEQTQMFFTLRQAVYNAYAETARSCPEGNGFGSLDFPADMPLAEQLEQLHAISGEICGVIVNSRRAQQMKDQVAAYVRGHYSDPGLCAERIAQELLISEKYVFAVIR